MIITRLHIEKLHGLYDYDVAFNKDLTFLIGENGCGKTTVLDIVSSIVTGRIYKLAEYKFEKISLFYRRDHARKVDEVCIIPNGDDYVVILVKEGRKETVRDIRSIIEASSREDDELSLDRRFMGMYDIPRHLRQLFNYIYLPLSRNSQDGIDVFDNMAYRRRRSIYYADRDVVNRNYLNESLRYVENIVRTGCMRISNLENSINARFRSSIFTSSLKVTSEYDIKSFLNSMFDVNTLSGIEKGKAEYVKTLKSIGEWNDDVEKRVEDFFKKYTSVFMQAQNDKDAKHSFTIDFLMMNNEFNRIKEIASQAQKIEIEKEKAKAPITSFLSTVNRFFELSEDKKRVRISDEGRVEIEGLSPYRRISLYDLSSGEKQIIIIFACLIFGLPANSSGIYIIDEPEASLHLAWQRIFVNSIQKVNSSIQLIFATHAPEVIGKYSDKTVPLKKVITHTREEREDEKNGYR